MPILGKDYFPGLEGKILNLKRAVEKEFPEIWTAYEACISVSAQLLLQDISNCVMIVLVGAPSGRKTTVIMAFAGIDEIAYRCDEFKPRSFVSHYAGVSEDKLKEIDLLPKVIGKILLTAELLPIFNAPYEVLLENFGIMTRVLDGQGYSSDSGVHGGRGYKGFEGDCIFHWIAGVAYVPHRIWTVIGNFGSRMYFFNMPDENVTLRQLVDEQKEDFKQKTGDVRKAVHLFLKELWKAYPKKVTWNKDKDSVNACEMIAKLSMMLSKLRGIIEYQRTSENDEDSFYTTPNIEQPHRCNAVLYNLARGHAIACGRNYLTTDDIPIVTKIALASASPDRVKLLDFLLSNKGMASTKEFKEYLKCSPSQAKKTMDELEILKIITKTKSKTSEEGGRPMFIAKLKDEYSWFLSVEFRNLWKK